MPAHNLARSSSLIAAVLAVVLAGCGSQGTTTQSGGSGQSGAPATASAPAADDRSTGPMSGPELVWLEGISALHKTMDGVLQDSPSMLTSGVMRSMAKQLGGCTPALNRLGPPTARLRPVQDLARQGCARYEEAGKCFATAASLGTVVQGSGDEKKQTVAINCGFDKPGDGSKLFADAEGKGFEVKANAH
jgi:hypothetical protein